jgi:hypothetical protein
MQQEPDEFQISLRILGNEIIGLQLKSESRARNWAAFGLISTAIIMTIFVESLPAIQALTGSTTERTVWEDDQ